MQLWLGHKDLGSLFVQFLVPPGPAHAQCQMYHFYFIMHHGLNGLIIWRVWIDRAHDEWFCHIVTSWPNVRSCFFIRTKEHAKSYISRSTSFSVAVHSSLLQDLKGLWCDCPSGICIFYYYSHLQGTRFCRVLRSKQQGWFHSRLDLLPRPLPTWVLFKLSCVWLE